MVPAVLLFYALAIECHKQYAIMMIQQVFFLNLPLKVNFMCFRNIITNAYWSMDPSDQTSMQRLCSILVYS